MAAREDHRDNVPRQGPCLPSCDRQHDDWADCAHYSRLHQVNCGEKEWELLRRYAEFHELDAQLAKAFDPATLPALPPKLIINEDSAIAERFLELDVYLRGLLANDAICRHVRLQDFLGVEKNGARYGIRRYECAPHAVAPCASTPPARHNSARLHVARVCTCHRYDSAHSEGNRYIRDNDL